MSQVKNSGTDRTDRSQQQQDEWVNNDPYGNEYGDYDFDGGNVEGGGEVQDYGTGTGVGGSYSSGTNPYGGGQTPGTGKGLATGGGFSEPPSSDATNYLQTLLQQSPPPSPAQIKQQMQQLYGWTPTDADIQYAKQGLGGFEGPPNGYPQYNGKNMGVYAKGYGSPEFTKFMDQQQMMQDAKGMTRDAKKKEQEAKVKIHMILLQIMMGDIAGALRSYAVLMDRDMRQFTRLIVKKLDGVRRARSTVIRNFARQQPPRAYAGNNPQTAARAQDKSAKYTQFVQMSTQLMNELQNTERELVDALQTQFRNLETFWQTVATFRDETFRTNDRVMTMR
jgi:hypothetical protein